MAWAQIGRATPETTAAMNSGVHPDIAFTDDNSANVHRRHDGLRRICQLASERQGGALIEWRALLFDKAQLVDPLEHAPPARGWIAVRPRAAFFPQPANPSRYY